MKRALEEQYGGEEDENDKDKIICDVDEKYIAEHLRVKLKKEQEDKRRYAQAHLYTIIKVARDADLLEQIGKDIYFDLVDHDNVHNFRIQKQTPFNQFKENPSVQSGRAEKDPVAKPDGGDNGDRKAQTGVVQKG